MTLSTNSITPLSESPGEATGGGNDLVAFDSEYAETNRSESRILNFSERTPVSLPDRTPVSLATLRRDRIQFDGPEAISIGQALCLALMTAQRYRRTKPDCDIANVVPPVTADAVFIDPASRLGVSVNYPGDEPAAIQSVGRILSEILPRDTRPPLETKIIAKALASPPQFGTVGELSEALEAFEQLRGRELIQAVYERWKRGDITAPTSSIRLGSQPLGVAVVIVVAILVAGISAGFLMRGSHADDSISASTEDSTITVDALPLLEARPIAPMSKGLPPWSVASAKRPAMSMSPLAVHAKRPAPTALSAAVAKTKRPAPPPQSPSIARTESPVVSDPPVPRQTAHLESPASQLVGRAEADATSLSGTNDVIRTSDVTRSSQGVRSTISPPVTKPVKNTPAPSRSVSDRFVRPVTYSARDVDVAPPIPVLPRLLAGLQPSSPGVRLDVLEIAVVVEPDGTAYSVTAVNAPQNMSEYVLLTSALAVVKSWEFKPATKDGTPVRYYLMVPVRAVTKSAP